MSEQKSQYGVVSATALALCEVSIFFFLKDEVTHLTLSQQDLLVSQSEFYSHLFGDCLYSAICWQKPGLSHSLHFRSLGSHWNTYGIQQSYPTPQER